MRPKGFCLDLAMLELIDWIQQFSSDSEERVVSLRICLMETEEGWPVSCLDLPGCHSQGDTREEALANIRETIGLWFEVEAEEAGIKQVETLELAI